ncbi:hypothetical protein ASG49_12480 [Marmoricola sp. Leaf446]|uniref:DinB family protein n=1 Tax=Marmoricola sp. Leaf446 TaxID=1736379 RepID=UPI0006FE3E67|nr:DinB family protein [Marmoricola sp. Leaf446]KQT91136.1 hypothetical protein ASG49_12480 [Marmoricola sp. Leaf446]
MADRTLDPAHPDHAELLLGYLHRARTNLLGALEGLSDHDVRRPLTPTGTSLLGLVKHVATVEAGYLGGCVGRPFPEVLPWDTDEGYAEAADMWATAEESRAGLLGLYGRTSAHGDASVRALGLEAPATVPWWPEERRRTTVGWVLVHLLEETAQHAGHADVLRESVDGRGGADRDELGDDGWWQAHVARVQAAADAHR